MAVFSGYSRQRKWRFSLSATRLGPFAAALAGGLFWISAPAAAEDEIRICGAAWAPALDSETESDRTVNVLCWGTWLTLGNATSFRATANIELDATLVELDREDGPLIFLIRPDAEGRPLIENMNAALADAAGRTPLGDLTGLAVDADRFAFTGQIGIALADEAAVSSPKPSDEASRSLASLVEARPGSDAAIGLDIGEYIARDEARLARAGNP